MILEEMGKSEVGEGLRATKLEINILRIRIGLVFGHTIGNINIFSFLLYYMFDFEKIQSQRKFKNSIRNSVKKLLH